MHPNPIHFLVTTVEHFVEEGQKLIFPKNAEIAGEITVPSGESKQVVDVTDSAPKLDTLVSESQQQIEQDLNVQGTLSGEVPVSDEVDVLPLEVENDVPVESKDIPQVVDLVALDDKAEALHEEAVTQPIQSDEVLPLEISEQTPVEEPAILTSITQQAPAPIFVTINPFKEPEQKKIERDLFTDQSVQDVKQQVETHKNNNKKHHKTKNKHRLKKSKHNKHVHNKHTHAHKHERKHKSKK